MKVAQIIPSLGYGGAEREVARMSTMLSKSGVNCEIICLYEEGHLAESVKNSGTIVNVLNLDKNGSLLLKFRRLTEFIRNNRYDIVHVHLVNWATISARLGGAKAVFLTEHGLSLYKNRRQILFDRFNSLFIDRIITVARAIYDVRLKAWKLPVCKLFYLPNSVDQKRFNFQADKKILKNELGIPEDDYFVLSVGSLLPVKGHEFLISAAAIVLQKFPNVTFAIAGGGFLQDTLLAQAKSLGIAHKFKFFGYRNDIERLLKTADLFALPSLREGISISILEAMAADVPVVASNVGGNPELIIDDNTGLLVPSRDPDSLACAIIRLLRDTNLRIRLAGTARERVHTEFSEEPNLKKLKDLYFGVLNEKHQALHH